jgi:hypothetical protein
MAQGLLDLNCDQILLGAEGKADWFTNLRDNWIVYQGWLDIADRAKQVDCSEFFPVPFECFEVCQEDWDCHPSLACVNGVCDNSP